VDPERVTAEFIGALKTRRAAVYVALHANHAREFTPAATAAIARIVDAGIPMLSQTVLLKGVNDDVEALADLMRAFVENRIKPYYLHHADLAPGTSHFRTTIERGQALMRGLRRRVSGIALPSYVLDIPGGHAKASLETCDVERGDDGDTRVRDDAGKWHTYLG
jgi:lysine 2,3-aminomutase